MLVVPDVTGKTVEEAQAIIRQAGFKGDIEESRPVDCDNRAPTEGRIRCQDPEPGKRAASYTLLQVAVYHKPSHHGRVTLDDLEALHGMTVAQARAKLGEYGFDGEVEVYAASTFIDGCRPDTVCRAASAGGIIQLVTNKQAAAIPVPD